MAVALRLAASRESDDRHHRLRPRRPLSVDRRVSCLICNPVLVFDIETIPDVPGLRRTIFRPGTVRTPKWRNSPSSSGARNGNRFCPHHLQRVAVISCALRAGKDFASGPWPSPEQNEAEIIQRFFDGIEKFTPQVVSWNGGGFDLPVLHYRGLIHGVVAPRYWDMGDGDYADSAISREQLHQPLPHPPSRPDGPAGDVTAARQRAARRSRQS